MKLCRNWRRITCALVVTTISLCFAAGTFADGTDTWTNTVSGLWSVGDNWSSNRPPDSAFTSILISNPETKTVTIDAATPTTNLSVSRLTLRAPTGFTNTLELVDLTMSQPLQILTAFTNAIGGALIITNSAIDATLATTFNIDAGTVTLESGVIDCTSTPVRIGRSGNASLLVNSGNVHADTMIVGELANSPGNLTLTGGVVDVSFSFTAGAQAGSTGIVSVANAQLSVTDPSITNKIGGSGVGQLTITSGGTVTFPSLSVGDGATAKGTVSVSGGQLNVTDAITKFGNAGFGQMTLSNDGAVNIATELILGDNAGGTGIVSVASGQFTVDNANDTTVGRMGFGQINVTGGTVTLLSPLILADQLGSRGTVDLTGGQLLATNGITSIGRFGVGNMTISNGTAILTNVSVGRHEGATGTLKLQTNGNLFQRDDLSIGRFTNAVGYVFVNGGLLSLTNDTIWVGREGIGYMTVSNGLVEARAILVAVSTVTPDPITGLPVTNTPAGALTLVGGTMLVSSNFVVGTSPFSTGQVSVIGGNLVVTNAAKTAYASVDNGSLTLTGGKIAVDNLFATNAAGHFSLNGGTLQMLGGVYSFTNGLVISSNATVTGCGTVTGNVVNYGTILADCPGQKLIFNGGFANFGSIAATNGGSVLARPTIISFTKTGSTSTIQCTSLSGSTYTLEYKNALSDLSWTPIPPAVPGTGSTITLSDPSAASASRLYRVRAQ